MKLHFFFIGIVFVACTLLCVGCKQNNTAEPNQTLAPWQPGYLDIHQISTGRGESAFLILPDSTTLLIDAGDLGDTTVFKQTIMPARPNDLKRPAERIAQYIRHFYPAIDQQAGIDFAMLTHFDTDHIGKADTTAIEAGLPYKLTGIAHVEKLLGIQTLIDRGYPDYDYPSKEKMEAFKALNNYRKLIAVRDQAGKRTEKFEVGSNQQMRLLNHPESYPEFEIRNVVGNGEVWTGEGNGKRLGQLVEHYRGENSASCGVRIRYGHFDYLTCGDIQGKPLDKYPSTMEKEVAPVVQNMDVVLANHHAYKDAMFEPFIQSTRPRVFIIPVWDFYHPEVEPLARMLDTNLYPDERLLFATGLVDCNQERLGENRKQIKPTGHIVTRVYEGGKQFQIFVLDDCSDNYEIIYQTERFNSSWNNN